MNQEIDHTLTDEEGNETHAIRFVQKENAVHLRLSETGLGNFTYWTNTSNIQVTNNNRDLEGIELMVNQNVATADTDYSLSSRIVISKNDAKRLISKLAHYL